MEDKKLYYLEDLQPKEELGISYNIDKITNKIFLGGIKGANEYEYFEKEKINNVLSITEEPPIYSKEKNINHKIIQIGDFFQKILLNISKNVLNL